jgi:hypothetical protein
MSRDCLPRAAKTTRDIYKSDRFLEPPNSSSENELSNAGYEKEGAEDEYESHRIICVEGYKHKRKNENDSDDDEDEHACRMATEKLCLTRKNFFYLSRHGVMYTINET